MFTTFKYRSIRKGIIDAEFFWAVVCMTDPPIAPFSSFWYGFWNNRMTVKAFIRTLKRHIT